MENIYLGIEFISSSMLSELFMQDKKKVYFNIIINDHNGWKELVNPMQHQLKH